MQVLHRAIGMMEREAIHGEFLLIVGYGWIFGHKTMDFSEYYVQTCRRRQDGKMLPVTFFRWAPLLSRILP